MSRGFVKEDDQEETPMVPQRAYLPDGVPNFVTRTGMDELLEERKMLISEKDKIDSTDENERRIALNLINARLQLLNDRIAGAKVITSDEQPHDEIRFGASVTLKEEASGKFHTYRIVGVDEADISKGKVSFISPLARVLINKKKGDKVILKQPKGNTVFVIMGITYI